MVDTMLENDELSVNTEDQDSDISLDESDPILNYTIIPNALIRDASLSPECRWLIIFLLSNKPGWKIRSSQLWKHTTGFIGRDKIRKLLKEAIESGYIRRDPILLNTPRGKLRRFNYTIASTPKFKKCLQCPEKQGPGKKGPINQGDKELLLEELLSLRSGTSLKVPEEPRAPKGAEMEFNSPSKVKNEKEKFAPEIEEIANEMIEALEETNPDYSPPKNLRAFQTQVDFMLRIDKRRPQNITDVFKWALGDSFWADKMFKPNPAKYLREKFDQLFMKMNAKPPTNPNKIDRRLRDMDGNIIDAYKDRMF